MPETAPVLVAGATGALGGQVVNELLANGRTVRALVRTGSDATRLEAAGVEIARGDMLDLDSLVTAMTGVDAVVSTAAGYTRRGAEAESTDTIGQANLAKAAAQAGVRRFVLTSILTCDQTPQVPHFWHKKLAEDALAENGVPYVALRPGAFLDQITAMSGDMFKQGTFMWFGNPQVPLTFVLTSDLARYLAAAVDAPGLDGQHIDIGWDRPVSADDVAAMATQVSGRDFTVVGPPPSMMPAPDQPLDPAMADMFAMFDWFNNGKYVADTTRQAEVFGPVPSAVDAVGRLLAS